MPYKDPEKQKQYWKKYRKQYYRIHKKELSDKKKIYWENNKEKFKDRHKNWKESHPDYYKDYKDYNKIWEKEHRKERNEYRRLKYKTHLGRISCLKRVNRRERELDFIPLNQIFEGSDGHHLDPKNVIFIPTELHRQYYGHTLKKPETMTNINIQAWSFMESQVY